MEADAALNEVSRGLIDEVLPAAQESLVRIYFLRLFFFIGGSDKLFSNLNGFGLVFVLSVLLFLLH